MVIGIRLPITKAPLPITDVESTHAERHRFVWSCKKSIMAATRPNFQSSGGMPLGTTGKKLQKGLDFFAVSAICIDDATGLVQ